jgi:hypothetical protein
VDTGPAGSNVISLFDSPATSEPCNGLAMNTLEHAWYSRLSVANRLKSQEFVHKIKTPAYAVIKICFGWLFFEEIYLLSVDYEVSLLRLIEKITNGSVIEISHTGTAILLKPGVLIGGPVVHDCPLSRSIGYFLEPIIAVAPFGKRPLMLTLRGITTDDKDLSVDLIRTVTLPHLAMFGVEEGMELKVSTHIHWWSSFL